jgi:hypothetical protein
MRTVAPALLASYLLFGMPHSAIAADKIKIEIVEVTTMIVMVAHTFPGTPEQITTHCDVRVDINCNSTVTPAADPASGLVPSFVFSAKAILPDGSHVELTCFPISRDKGCKGITPLTTNNSMPGCVLDAIAAFARNAQAVAGNTASCTTKNPGFYQAKREKNGLVIYSPNGKLRYQIAGSW